MDDYVCPCKFFSWYEFLTEQSKKPQKSGGIKLPEVLKEDDYWIYRVALSDRFKDSYHEISTKWDLEELAKALRWIDIYEKLEEEQMKKANDKKGR